MLARTLRRFPAEHNFKVSEADPCLYVRERNGKKILLVVYVDDGLAAATDTQDLEEFLDELKSEFKIVSNKAECFLGLEIKKQENGLKISQQGYATRILERFRFSDCEAVSTPLLKNLEITTAGKESETTAFPYRQAIGALMYLMLGTRPDLAFSIGFLSRTLENPTKENIAQVKRVFRYISGTINVESSNATAMLTLVAARRLGDLHQGSSSCLPQEQFHGKVKGKPWGAFLLQRLRS